MIIHTMDRPSSKQSDEFNLAEELVECLAALPRLQAEARATETKKKAAWRAKNPEKDRSTARVRYAKNAEKDRADTRAWRAANPDKVRAQKRRETDANYFRPFVATDSECQNYAGEDIVYQEVGGPVRYARHDTHLWGAAADDGREPEWLTNGPGKQPLSVYKIVDWLLSLPKKFGQAIFVSFAFGYDATQIFKSLPRKTVWEILKRETYPDETGAKKTIGSSPVLWDEFAFSYIKGKYLEIWKLRDRDKPHGDSGKLDTISHIKIFDTFSFFQEGLSKVVFSMVATDRASEEEAEYLSAMKKSREDVEGWAAHDIEDVKRYTTLELRLLARMMADMRKSFDEMDGMRLRGWHGPGAAASALLEHRKIKENHFPSDIAAEEIPPWQDAAHHTFHGGHIEPIKQGFFQGGLLHCYDIVSSYPSGTVDLPSMRDGKWTKRGYLDFHCLAKLRGIIEGASQLSMYKVKYLFPEYEKYHIDISRAIIIPFYPLPYRQKRGGIIYPARGYGWYNRDDVLAAILWLERFVPDYPRRRKKENKDSGFIIEEAWVFERAPANEQERPFAGIGALYNERKKIKQEIEKTKKYDIREKAIKLTINSVYGQLARSVGTIGRVPFAANPYYAAAITAHIRRRLMEAALLNPHAVVFFATDGIVATEELPGLSRVRRDGDDIDLGDWEYYEADSGLFVMSGVYTYGKVKTDKNGVPTIEPVSKLRGADPKKYTREMAASAWLIRETLSVWRLPADQAGESANILSAYKKYITAGNALASPRRWKLAGRWSPPPGLFSSGLMWAFRARD